jgi:tripartite-type tricarboxylate transporter receptor subunit TctC
MVKSIQAPETRERLASHGARAIGTSPGEFLAFWRAEHERWGKIIRTAGIKIE